MKDIIVEKLKSNIPSFKKFELLEHLALNADNVEDIYLMLEFLKNDSDPMIRHEVAAQLLKIEQINPNLMNIVKEEIVSALKYSAINDVSIIVRHEAIEAIGYIGAQTEIYFLKDLISSENIDIKSTATVSYDSLIFRLKNDIGAKELGDFILISDSLNNLNINDEIFGSDMIKLDNKML